MGEEYALQLAGLGFNVVVHGRSASKLQSIISEIQPLNPDRTQPSIEECPLEAAALHELAKKTRVLVNCIGPYALYGEPVLKACVNNGTAYIDTTGEIPWVLKMVRKYHERARETGAISTYSISYPPLPSLSSDLQSDSHSIYLRICITPCNFH